MWVASVEGKEKWDISGLVTDIMGGKVKEEEFEREERGVADIEAFRECERVWECLGPLRECNDGRPLPSLKDSNWEE